MGQTITFFPEGNAECIFLELDNGKRMLMDYANMHSNESKYTDLTESLKDIDTFDVVMFTHPHDDHVKGAADFFCFDHAVKYQTGKRAKIKELWISAAFLLDVNLCEDARVIRQEARYRLKECGGKGVKIFAAPGALASWLEENELSTEENDYPIIHAGTLLEGPQHNLGDEISIFVHAPFSEDAEDVDNRNDPSIVIQIALENADQTTNLFITGDTPHDVLDKIVKRSESSGNADNLKWDLYDIPHHCSYTGLSDEKGEDITLKNLKLNRKRTIVTIVGIILATALLSALVTLVSSFQYSMIEYQKQKGGDFHVKFSNVKMSELSEFKNNRNIESTFETMGMGFAKLDGCKNEDKPYAYVMATDEAGFERGCFKLIEGRMAKNEDEIVIPRHLKTNGRIDIKVGDEITLDVGKRYDSNTEGVISENSAYENEAETLTDTVTKHYKVVGIMERPGYGMEDYSAAGYTFVTYSDELAAIDNGTKSEASEADTTLTVYSRYTKKALRNKDAVTADIIGVDEKLFEKANKSSVEMSAEESDRFLKEMENAKYDIYMNGYLISYECVFPIDGSFKALFTVAAVVALIIILTSVYCIKNSFNISITEKIRQYGMLASVGATRRQIKSSVKTEAAMLGVVGIPVGTMSGILASLILVKVVNALSAGWLNFALSFHTSLPALILAVIMSIATIYFSATGSARRAAKVTPWE